MVHMLSHARDETASATESIHGNLDRDVTFGTIDGNRLALSLPARRCLIYNVDMASYPIRDEALRRRRIRPIRSESCPDQK